MPVRFFTRFFTRFFRDCIFKAGGQEPITVCPGQRRPDTMGVKTYQQFSWWWDVANPRTTLLFFNQTSNNWLSTWCQLFFTCTVFAIWLSQQFCTFLPHWLWQQHWRWYLHDTSLHWPTPVKCNWVVFARKMVPQQNSQWQFWASVWTCYLWHACRKVYQLGTFHTARPDVPMRAINNIAGCLGLTQHDDQWCLGPGMPVAEIPCGVSSSRWCLSGWIFSREDQERYRSALARRGMIRTVFLLGCTLGLPSEAMRTIFEWMYWAATKFQPASAQIWPKVSMAVHTLHASLKQHVYFWLQLCMCSINGLRLPAGANPNSCSAEAVLGQLVPSWWPCFSICLGLSQDGDLHVQAVKAKLLCWFKDVDLPCSCCVLKPVESPALPSSFQCLSYGQLIGFFCLPLVAGGRDLGVELWTDLAVAGEALCNEQAGWQLQLW